MYAEDIIGLDLEDISVRRRIVIYVQGIDSGEDGLIDFVRLKERISDMGCSQEETRLLTAEFIRGYLAGCAEA